MRPRYDFFVGGLELVLVAGLFAVFGVPRAPPFAASWALFVVAGLLGVAAGFRPEWRVGGYTVDFVVLRGLGTCCVAFSTLLVGASQLTDGGPFGIMMVGSGLFVAALGVGTLLRRPTFVPEVRGA